MPLVRIDVIRGRDPEQLRTLLDTIHDAMLAALNVPDTDRYQILTQRDPGDIVALDTGLGSPAPTASSAAVRSHEGQRLRTSPASTFCLTDRVTGDDVTTLRLPLSGMVYQRRDDGRWRCVHPAQYADEQSDGFQPHPDEWVPADRPVEGGGRAQRTPGSGPRDEETWWLAYGDNRFGPVTVTLADGHTPPIITFGPLWISEWVSRWQAAAVFDGKRSYQIFHRVPHYIESQNLE